MPVTLQVVASRPKELQPVIQAQPTIQPASGAQSVVQVTAESLQFSAQAQPVAAEPQPTTSGALPSSHPATTFQETISAEEVRALFQEIHEDETVVVSKKRRLNAGEKKKIRSAVTDGDRRSLRAAILDSVSGMVHISGIKERRQFWEHIKINKCFVTVCDHFISEYTRLHKECDKGADKYATFYLNWYGLIQAPTTADFLSTCRGELRQSYSDTITDDTWTTLVTTILHASFNAIQTLASQYIPSTGADHMQLATVPTVGEDDVALLRLGGWALFSCIDYRKRALQGKSKTKHSSSKLEVYKAELGILESLVDHEKVGLPCAIIAQDRGYLTLPRPSVLPFIREVNKSIKDSVNPLTYEMNGSKLFDVSAKKVLGDEEGKKEWALVASSTSESDPKVVNSTRQAMTLKMLHSQFKEFTTKTRMLETMEEGKTVDTDVALRAKLKTHATEKHLNLK